MKRILLALVVAFLVSAPQLVQAQTNASSEQTAFFTTMNAAYMAWKNNNNVEAVRQSADAIYSQAMTWKQAAGSTLPKTAKKDMKKVVKLSKQLKKMAAKTGNDEDVKQKIAHLHSAYNSLAAATGGPTS